MNEVVRPYEVPAPLAFEEYLRQNPKRVLIIDFDGTLFTLEYPWQAFRQGIKEITAIDPVMVEGYRGELVVPLINLAVAKHGRKAKEPVCAFRETFEQEHLKAATPNRDLIEFIKNHPEYIYFIWSNNMESTIARLLRQQSIYEHFEKIISMDKVELAKPYPDGFYSILNLA